MHVFVDRKKGMLRKTKWEKSKNFKVCPTTWIKTGKLREGGEWKEVV